MIKLNNIRLRIHDFVDRIMLPTYILEFPPIQLIAEISPEEWAPGIWAGAEGLKFTVTKVDMDKREITLELK